MYATKENLSRKIIFTKHAKLRAAELGIPLVDLEGMLLMSDLRRNGDIHTINKIARHGTRAFDYVFDDIKFVVYFEPHLTLIITLHKG